MEHHEGIRMADLDGQTSEFLVALNSSMPENLAFDYLGGMNELKGQNCAY